MFKNREKQTYRKAPLREYSDYDLKEFHEQMQKYRTEVTLRNGDIVRPYDEVQFLKDVGAMDEDGIVIKDRVYDLDGKLESATVPYEEYQNKLGQWKMWIGRQEFGKQKRMEDLEKVAETITESMQIGPEEDLIQPEFEPGEPIGF